MTVSDLDSPRCTEDWHVMDLGCAQRQASQMAND